MVFLEKHDNHNAPLKIFLKHKLGFIKHAPFINVNGLAKYMIPPKKLNELDKKFGIYTVNADVGDVLLFFIWVAYMVGS